MVKQEHGIKCQAECDLAATYFHVTMRWAPQVLMHPGIGDCHLAALCLPGDHHPPRSCAENHSIHACYATGMFTHQVQLQLPLKTLLLSPPWQLRCGRRC